MFEKFLIERALIKSSAFRSLNSTSIIVLMDFLARCQIHKVKTTKQHIIKNNGEIVYTYDEAENKGIRRARFARAIDELIEHGFIDITRLGSGGRKGDVSLYSISERWRDYRTEKFISASRPKDTRKGRGFKVYWERQKSILSITGDTPTSITNDTPKRKKKSLEYHA